MAQAKYGPSELCKLFKGRDTAFAITHSSCFSMDLRPYCSKIACHVRDGEWLISSQTLDGCCNKRGLPVVSGRKKMQKMVATTWQPAKRRYTPHSILQSIVKKLCSMMAPFSRETSTVIPWPRHLVSRGWTSAEMTQPV